MNDKILKFAMLCFISLLMIACNKDIDEEMLDVPDGPVPVVEQVEMDLLVIVDRLIADKSICIIKGEHYSFNSQGILCLDNFLFSVKGEWLRIETDGHNSVLKYVIPRVNGFVSINANSIRSYKKADEFDSMEGAVYGTEDFELEYPAMAFVDESGIIYNGVVQPSLWFRNEIYLSENDIVPNVFYKDIKGNDNAVFHYMWLEIEFRDDANNLLKISKDKTVKFKYKQAYSNMDRGLELFTFDKDLNLWRNEGISDFKDGWVLGELKNDGLFVFGKSRQSNLVEFKILDSDSNPVIHEEVVIWEGGSTFPYNTNSDGEGFVRAPAPIGLNFHVGVVYYCNGIGHVNIEKQATEYSESILQLSDCEMDQVKMKKFSGKLLACDSLPYSNHLMMINNHKPIVTEGDGSFVFYIKDCHNSAEYKVLSCDGEVRYDRTFTDLNEAGDLGTVFLCP